MTLSSYKVNVALGVTGREMETCMPASWEQVVDYGGFSPGVYPRCPDFVRWYNPLSEQQQHKHAGAFYEVLDNMAWELGGYGCDDIVFKRAASRQGFERTIRQLLAKDFSVVVDLRLGKGNFDIHAVGIIPTTLEDRYKLVSNNIPRGLRGLVTLEKVSELMDVPPTVNNKHFAFEDANITGLPPVD